jgi:hypothetical protein
MYMWPPKAETARLLRNCATVQLCNCATVQLCNCATVQLCNCTTVQLYIEAREARRLAVFSCFFAHFQARKARMRRQTCPAKDIPARRHMVGRNLYEGDSASP